MTARQRAAQRRLVRTEVADVVARPQQHVGFLAARCEPLEHREQLEQIVRLEEPVGLIGGAAHRDGELDLPAVHAVRDDHLEHVGQLGHD